MKASLTVRSIEGMKAGPKSVEIHDTAGVGLSIIIHPTGRRVWAWRGRIRGKLKKLTLGEYPLHGLQEARRWAASIQEARDLDLVRWGDLRSAEVAAAAFSEQAALKTCDWLFSEYIKLEGGRLKSRDQIVAFYTRNVSPVIGSSSIFDLNHDQLMAVVELKLSNSPTQANHTASLLKRLFRWAVTKRRSSVGLINNPAEHIYKPAKLMARDRYLSDAEIRILQSILKEDSSAFAAAIKLILHTAVRRSEAFHATWDEFDFVKGYWTIPAARTKSGISHLVPLPPRLKLWLEQRYTSREGDLLFPRSDRSGRPIAGFSRLMNGFRSSVAERLLVERVVMKNWTIHDLRRTVATGMQGILDEKDMPKIPSEVVERILSHAQPGIKRIYNRYEYIGEKRRALTLWENHLRSISLG